MSFGQKARFINELCGGPRSLAVLFLPPDFGHQGLYFGGKFNEFIGGHADGWGNFSHMIDSFALLAEIVGKARFPCWEKCTTGKFSFTSVFGKGKIEM
ncbi:MAG: hypothetical protein ACYCOR_19085 [Acidobacteriaceae bacterium]